MTHRWSRATFWVALVGLGPTLGGQTSERIAQLEQLEAEHRVVFEGIVVDSSGAPVEAAVVVSSAGGRAVTDRSGSYRLEVDVSADARTVQVTAGGGTDGKLLASTSVDLAAGSALARVGPLVLSSGSTCQPSWLPTFGGLPGTQGSVLPLPSSTTAPVRRSTSAARSRQPAA